MVVQEILQMRWEPWRWGVQWPTMGSWQWWTETITEADPLKITQEVAEKLNINHSTFSPNLAFEENWIGEKGQ